ncbi:MAG: ROK family glucokinase [Candidatus Hydrogenedentes bacterium]|nr:ROK family glucokinase [Candidatus Hydrogenedentota bacterium]
MSRNKLTAGIDLGGTNVKTALCDADGKVISKDSRPTDAELGLDAVVARMAEGFNQVVEDAGLNKADVLAAGIGAPGPMNWQTGVVFAPPNLPGWKDVPLAGIMTERLGIPVFVDNDANVACYGEFCAGAGRDVDSLVLLTLGTGIGGGIVVLGQLLRGPDGTAAEVGHLCVMRDGRQCNCGARGCLEAYASVTGMQKIAAEGINEGKTTLLTQLSGGDLDKIDGAMINEAALKGDAFAAEIMCETGRWLGTGIGSLINLLNPEMVVLAGGMAAAGDILLEPLRETALAQSFDVPGKRAEVVLAHLWPDSGVIGAAGVARDRFLQK